MEQKQTLKALYHCIYNLNFHLVVVTKYRRKCLTEPMRQSLRDIFATTREKWGGTLLECNGEPDHMHLLFEVPPTVQLSKCVNSLKTVSSATASAEGRFAPWRHCVGAGRPRPSSRLLRKAYGPELTRWYRQPVLWSRSYCVLSCGGAPLSVLRQYIEQQGSAS